MIMEFAFDQFKPSTENRVVEEEERIWDDLEIINKKLYYVKFVPDFFIKGQFAFF